MILELRNQNKPTKKTPEGSISEQLANYNLDENYNEKYKGKNSTSEK